MPPMPPMPLMPLMPMPKLQALVYIKRIIDRSHYKKIKLCMELRAIHQGLGGDVRRSRILKGDKGGHRVTIKNKKIMQIRRKRRMTDYQNFIIIYIFVNFVLFLFLFVSYIFDFYFMHCRKFERI